MKNEKGVLVNEDLLFKPKAKKMSGKYMEHIILRHWGHTSGQIVEGKLRSRYYSKASII